MSFSFDKGSLKGEVEYNNSLEVSPISGVVRAQSEVPIVVRFCP